MIEYHGAYQRIENYGVLGLPGVHTPQDVEERWTLAGGAVLVTRRTTSGTASEQTRYVLEDHLGTTEVILDSAATVVERLSYDAWGRKRNASTWQDLPAGAVPRGANTDQGFTGHEQLDHLGLVHLGGRVYDPVLGRFLSADPIIQAPCLSQSHNCYSYCINNPLSLTDPTGYSWLSDLGNKIGSWFLKHTLIGHIRKFQNGLMRRLGVVLPKIGTSG